MNLIAAIEHLSKGEKVRRIDWPQGEFVYESANHYFDDNHMPRTFTAEDAAAQWELNTPHDINWAIGKLEEGEKIRLPGWGEGRYIYKSEINAADFAEASWANGFYDFPYYELK